MIAFLREFLDKFPKKGSLFGQGHDSMQDHCNVLQYNTSNGLILHSDSLIEGEG